MVTAFTASQVRKFLVGATISYISYFILRPLSASVPLLQQIQGSSHTPIPCAQLKLQPAPIYHVRQQLQAKLLYQHLALSQLQEMLDSLASYIHYNGICWATVNWTLSSNFVADKQVQAFWCSAVPGSKLVCTTMDQDVGNTIFIQVRWMYKISN